MKVTYTPGSGDEPSTTEYSEEVLAALQDLPVRAAGFALVGLTCPHEDMRLDFVRVGGTVKDGKPYGDITVTFGDDRCEDVLTANLS